MLLVMPIELVPSFSLMINSVAKTSADLCSYDTRLILKCLTASRKTCHWVVDGDV
jgi:hypothetical protein